MKFTIDRSKWSRADQNAKLVRPSDGKMCCLGFFLLACGLPQESVLDDGEPQEPFQRNPLLTVPPPASWLVEVEEPDEDDDDDYGEGTTFSCSVVGGDLIETNDSMDLTEAERERRISLLFGGQGIEVEFVGGTDPSGGKA